MRMRENRRSLSLSRLASQKTKQIDARPRPPLLLTLPPPTHSPGVIIERIGQLSTSNRNNESSEGAAAM